MVGGQVDGGGASQRGQEEEEAEWTGEEMARARRVHAPLRYILASRRVNGLTKVIREQARRRTIRSNRVIVAVYARSAGGSGVRLSSVTALKKTPRALRRGTIVVLFTSPLRRRRPCHK